MNKRISIVVLMLLAASVVGFAGGQKENQELSAEPDAVVSIKVMTCDLCSKAIRKSLLSVEGIEEAVVSHDEDKAFLLFDAEVPDTTIEEAVQRAGYQVVKIERISES